MAMLKKHLDHELSDLRDLLLEMGGFVEKAIEESIKALLEKSEDRCKRVHEIEREINRSHKKVDEECFKLLASQAPLATDLRLILATVKINTDLERMGDQAVNIAYHAENLIKSTPLKPFIDIPRMADEAQKMVRDALDAFVTGSEVLAKSVVVRDDVIDLLKEQIQAEMLNIMEKDPKLVRPGLQIIQIAKNLERLGDHATNIAEDVIFIRSGEDIRHPGTTSGERASG